MAIQIHSSTHVEYCSQLLTYLQRQRSIWSTWRIQKNFFEAFFGQFSGLECIYSFEHLQGFNPVNTLWLFYQNGASHYKHELLTADNQAPFLNLSGSPVTAYKCVALFL